MNSSYDVHTHECNDVSHAIICNCFVTQTKTKEKKRLGHCVDRCSRNTLIYTHTHARSRSSVYVHCTTITAVLYLLISCEIDKSHYEYNYNKNTVSMSVVEYIELTARKCVVCEKGHSVTSTWRVTGNTNSTCPPVHMRTIHARHIRWGYVFMVHNCNHNT